MNPKVIELLQAAIELMTTEAEADTEAEVEAESEAEAEDNNVVDTIVGPETTEEEGVSEEVAELQAQIDAYKNHIGQTGGGKLMRDTDTGELHFVPDNTASNRNRPVRQPNGKNAAGEVNRDNLTPEQRSKHYRERLLPDLKSGKENVI